MKKFETGQKDEFLHTEEAPLGDIVGVRIGHNEEFGSWYLDKVEILHEATAERWVFVDGGWLKREELKNRKYKCEKKVDATAEDHPTSEKVGELRPGDTILVSEAPIRVALNAKGKMSNQRVRYFRGESSRWVDLENKNGEPHLQDMDCPVKKIDDPVGISR